MNILNKEKQLASLKTAPKFVAEGKITFEIDGKTTEATDVIIQDSPDNSLVGLMGADIVIVQFPTLTKPGTYNLKDEKHVWIYISLNGVPWDAETGSLTLEIIEMRSSYKGSFDFKTKDHRKVDGTFNVRRI
ncbi:hypothetical protein [Pseudomonas sp. R1-7]|uniref:hypothetical protein n=1 Tax=Pseudomonas sp. R1-7 TaxID=2817398 RepID=UPI003DA95325